MAKQNKTFKRDSAEVDKLVAEVDRLNAGGMSINKACAKVGIQNTVYYFRKRRDQALEKLEAAPSVNSALHDHKDLGALTQEYRELEARLNAIKLKIAEKVMSQDGKSKNA